MLNVLPPLLHNGPPKQLRASLPKGLLPRTTPPRATLPVHQLLTSKRRHPANLVSPRPVPHPLLPLAPPRASVLKYKPPSSRRTRQSPRLLHQTHSPTHGPLN